MSFRQPVLQSDDGASGLPPPCARSVPPTLLSPHLKIASHGRIHPVLWKSREAYSLMTVEPDATTVFVPVPDGRHRLGVTVDVEELLCWISPHILG